MGALIAIGALAIALVAVAAPTLNGRVYRNDDCRITQLDLPRNWEGVPPAQIGYPHVLVVALHHDGGARLVLAVQRAQPGADALTLATSASPVLLRQGWTEISVTPDGEQVRLEAKIDGARLVRQLYIVHGDLAYVVTLLATADRAERLHRDLDIFARSLRDHLAPIAFGDGGAVLGDNAERCK